jgi:hypothetical protein
MSLNTINESIEKLGLIAVQKILSEEVIITEKIDTYRILFERVGDTINFYKKDNTPIDLVSRTLTDIYEDSIIELSILIENANVPENMRFGLYYTPDERPLRIPYTNIPKYILTDITCKNGTKPECLDYDMVTEWAGNLCIGMPPIIFKGKLSQDQISKLIAYDNKTFLDDYEDTVTNFSHILTGTINSPYSKQDIIEGIIIKSKDRLFQVISYEFDILNEAYEHITVPRDFYDLTLMSVINFLNEYSLALPSTVNKETAYISIINDIFNKYCAKNILNESIESKYLTPRQYGYAGQLNKKFIDNKETLTILSKGKIYESLYKVMLSSFRKNKKPYGLLNESMIEKFNTYVYLINTAINNFDIETETLNEAVEPEVSVDLNKEMDKEKENDNVVVDAINRREYTDVDNMRVISSIQVAFEPKARDITKGKAKCAIYLTTYRPFTNAQMENINKIIDKWNVPVIIAAISNKFKMIGTDFILSDELVKSQMSAICNFNKETVPFNIMLDSWNLKEIFEYCRPDYEPIVIITDIDKKSDLMLQLYFEEEMMGHRINVDKDFNIGELDNTDRLMALRSIEDSDASSFNTLVPQAIKNFYYNIIEEYKIWVPNKR